MRSARRALSQATDDELGYGNPQGSLELRRALTEYLARARGVRARPERIVICTGFTQAFGLLCTVLRRQGATTVAIEGYGMNSNVDQLVDQSLRPLTLLIDEQGAVFDSLEDAPAVLLTPAHQFPLGPVLAAGRRTIITGWAASGSGLIIEDDYDGEFRYDRQPVGALQALAPEHVAYVGTGSKTLAPALRLAWLVLPAHLVHEVVSAKMRADRQTGFFEQLTLADFISSGSYDRHVRRSRLAYRRRRDRLAAELHKRSPRVQLTGLAAGLHAVLQLPAGMSEADVIDRAAARDLALEGLSRCRLGRQEKTPAVVVGYGTPPEHSFTGAIGRLSAVLAG